MRPTKNEMVEMIRNTLTRQVQTTTSGKALTASPEMARHVENLIGNQTGNLATIMLGVLDELLGEVE